jgi:hypoxanthine phosphoribosyltransferase
MKKIYYSYDDAKLDMSVIYDRYMSQFSFPPDSIVGLSRGGLIPAVHLSHMFEVPLIPLRWSTRDFMHRDDDVLQSILSMADDGAELLIVDDIFDSGDTLVEIASHFHEGYTEGTLPVFASLITNQDAKNFLPFIEDNVLITGTYMNKGPDDWIVFPWEK